MNPIYCRLLVPMLIGNVHHDVGDVVLIPYGRAQTEIADRRAVEAKAPQEPARLAPPTERTATLHRTVNRRESRPGPGETPDA
jgi:hypothetical protein